MDAVPVVFDSVVAIVFDAGSGVMSGSGLGAGSGAGSDDAAGVGAGVRSGGGAGAEAGCFLPPLALQQKKPTATTPIIPPAHAGKSPLVFFLEEYEYPATTE